MSATWPYALMAKEASEYGGPQKYIDEMKAGSKFEGRVEGLLVCAAIAGVIEGYKYLKKRNELASIAERTLLEGMKGASDRDNPSSGDC